MIPSIYTHTNSPTNTDKNPLESSISEKDNHELVAILSYISSIESISPEDKQRLRSEILSILQFSHEHYELQLRTITENMFLHETELEAQNEELRQAQHIISISNQRYKMLFENAPIGYAVVDGLGFILEANAIFRSWISKEMNPYFSHARESVLFFVKPTERPVVQKAISQTLRNQSSFLEFTLVHKHSEERIIHASLVSFSELHETKPVCLIAMSDITAQRKAQMELEVHKRTLAIAEQTRYLNERLQEEIIRTQQAEAKFRGIVTAIPDMLFVNRADGTFLEFYAPDESMLLMPPEHFIGKKIEECLPVEYQSFLLLPLQTALAEKQIVTKTYSLNVPSQGERFFESRSIPLNDEEVLTIVRERTREIQLQKAEENQAKELAEANIKLQVMNEIKALNEQLQEQIKQREQVESRFKQFVEHAPNSFVIVFDADFRYQFLSGTEMNRLQLDEKDFVGRSIYEILDTDIIENIKLPIQKALQGEQTLFETRFADSYYAVSATPLIQNTKNIAEVLLVAQNIAPIKKAVDDIRQAKEAAEQANELKDEILSIAAHDLKNPLNAIKLASETIAMMVEREPLPKETLLKRSRSIYKATDQMLAIISGLLESYKIESGNFSLSCEIHCIKNLTEKIIDSLRMEADRKSVDISLRTNIDSETIPAFFDLYAAEQVLDNLISNALKFSPQETKIVVEINSPEYIHINQSHPFFPQADDFVIIAVHDQGPGLTESDKTKLFKKFAKLSAQPTGGEISTGIGLSISKQYVTAMNGKIWAETPPEGGSIFIFTLPKHANTNSIAPQ